MIVSIFLSGGSFLTDVAPTNPNKATGVVQTQLGHGNPFRGVWNSSNSPNIEAAYRTAMRNGHEKIVRFNPDHVRFLSVPGAES